MGARLSFNLGLPDNPITENSQLYSELVGVYNAIKSLAYALQTYAGIGSIDLDNPPPPDQTVIISNLARVVVVAGAVIAAGSICTFYDNAGTLEAKPAGGATWTDARGIAVNAGGVGDNIEFRLLGLFKFGAIFTPGTLYYLSNITAGTISAIRPSTPGDTIQPIGYALNTTDLYFNPSMYTELVP